VSVAATLAAVHACVAEGGRYALENAFLRRTFSTEGGILRTVEVENKLAGVTAKPSEAPEFKVRLSNGTDRPESAFTLTAADFRVADMRTDKGRLVFALECEARQLRVEAAYELAEDAPYLRKRLTLTSGRPLVLERVDVEALSLPEDAYQPYTVREITARAAGRWSPGLGQPLYGAKSATFWGVEFPAADNRVAEGALTAGYLYGRALQAGQPYAAHAAVMGVADDAAFVKDAFFEYIERVRARPQRLQVQFNSWFDTGGGVSKDNFAASVSKIHQELVVARGCRPLNAYVVDDGWQDKKADWSAGVWTVNNKFDADFASTLADVRAAGSRLGLWLSPGCLFGASAQVPNLRAAGFEALDDWMSMAGPKYMAALEERMVGLTRQGVGFFKLDGVFGHLNTRNFELRGGRYGLPELPQLVGEDLKGNDPRLNDAKYDEPKIYYLSAGAERLSEIFRKQAQVDPEVYILISNGAWLSPWWLMHVDAVWMINAGDAAGGSSRTKELVYRDERYHEFAVRQSAQFPLAAVFNHEPKKLHSRESKDAFRKYLYMHLSRGSGFVELYIKPGQLAAYDWDVLAEGLQWAYAVFPAFGRARMHGGNPGDSEVYGYTAWTRETGYVSVHNPADEARTYAVKLDRAFGLPAGGGAYHVSSPLEGSARGLPQRVKAGDTLTFALEPREVRVVCFTEQPQAWEALKRLQARTAEDYAAPPPQSAEGHPLLGAWTYQHKGKAYTREFRKDGTCVLRMGQKDIWTKPFSPDGPNTLVVEGDLRHELTPDGRLRVEGRYTATRPK